MRYFLVLLFSLLTACGAGVPSLKPYKMDIQQGNVVTSKMLLQLRPGMTKSQVRYIMGTPLVVDSFHRDRWDYFYQMRQGGKIVEQRRVILEFEKELLVRVRGDVVPAGAQSPEGAAQDNPNKTIEVAPTKREEKGWTDKLKFWKKDEKPVDAPKPQAAPETKPAAPAPEPASASPSVDAPSVLVVPVVPAAPPAEPVKVEPMQTESVPEPVKAEPVVPAAPAAEATKAEPAPMPKPAQPRASTPAKDDKLIFRMDKNMHTPVEESAAPAPVAAPAAPKAPAKTVEPPPEEEGPGYFERILEKIGF